MRLLAYMRRHGKNDDTPYAIGGMVGILAFLILGVFSLSVIDHYLLRSSSLAAVISAVLVDLTNGDRSVKSLGGLTINPVLTEAAQAKANDMAQKGYFAHVSPHGENSWYWFKQAGYLFTYAGENLAVDFSDSIDVEHAWMNSPTHRANILNGNFTEIGIAVAQGTYQGHPTTFVVQMFGAPAESSTQPEIRTNVSPAEPTAPALATTKSTPVRVSTAKVSGASSTVIVATTSLSAGTTLVLGAETGAPVLISTRASWWQHLLASPKTMLQSVYYALAFLILILFAFVTEFEFHRRHLRHVFASAFLFVLMAGLFTLANTVFFATPTLAASQTSMSQ